MSPEESQTIALKALAWIVTNDDLRDVFLGSTGSAASDLINNADDPALLASVLDFLTMDDAWVMAFCDANDLAYEQPLRARLALPGAEQIHWT